MKTRAPSFSASEVRFALASYCKCLTSHLPRCALVHTHIGQPHAPATLRTTHAPAQTHAPKWRWRYLHSHALRSLSSRTRTKTLTCTIMSRTALVSIKSNLKRHATSFA